MKRRNDIRKSRTPMQDLLVGKNANFHSLGGETPMIQAPPKIQLPTFDTDQITKIAESTQKYNKELKEMSNILPCYLNFKPVQHFIVRMFVREATFSESGLFTGQNIEGLDYVEFQVTAGSGSRYTQRHELSPFRFQTRAMIVATPKYAEGTNLQAGTEVVVPMTKSQAVKVGNHEFITFANSFVHPDSGKLLAVTEIGSDHYGYAMLSADSLLGIINYSPNFDPTSEKDG